MKCFEKRQIFSLFPIGDSCGVMELYQWKELLPFLIIMTKREFKDLLEKYLAGNCNQEETLLLEKFYDHFQKDDSWNHMLGSRSEMEEALLENIRRRIRKSEREEQFDRKNWMWPVLKIAATVAVLFALSLFSYLFILENQPNQEVLVDKATIEGQKSTLILSDGTQVRLNSKSKVRFPEKFAQDRREIILEGEAFFEVARDESRPFIIKSGDIRTTVLGTSFNVKAFEKEDVQVTVATGKVKVENTAIQMEGKPISLTLSPHQQANCDISSGVLEKKEVDIDPFLAWKDGVIRIQNLNLAETALILERWYGVSISFENEEVKQCRVSNGTYKDENLINILKSFEYFLDIDFRVIEGKNIVIGGSGCK